MFNWTTTRIINASPSTSGTLDEKVIKYDATKEIFRISRDLTFEKKYIRSIHVARPNTATITTANVNLGAAVTAIKSYITANSLTSATACLNFYIQLDGSEESIYANDEYKKGKPFSIGFKVDANSSAATVASEIINAVSKYALALYGRDLFTISEFKGNTSANTTVTGVTISGTHEFQRLVSISVTIDTPFDTEKIASWEYGDTVNSTSDGTGFVVALTYGKNAFGTYNYIVRNLRVPTAENTKFYKLREDETPIVGAMYTQFIITYCAPSMAKPSLTIIGHEGMSTTTHIFWVQGDVNTSATAAYKFAQYFTNASDGTPAGAGLTLYNLGDLNQDGDTSDSNEFNSHVSNYVAPSVEDEIDSAISTHAAVTTGVHGLE